MLADSITDGTIALFLVLFCRHVNRSPQENLVVPALTRTWDGKAKGAVVAREGGSRRVRTRRPRAGSEDSNDGGGGDGDGTGGKMSMNTVEVPHASQLNAFFLLQDVIRGHLRECGAGHANAARAVTRSRDTRAFHKLTLEMSTLLRALIEYGFYGSTAYIKDLVPDLIVALRSSTADDDDDEKETLVEKFGSAPEEDEGDASESDDDDNEDRPPIGGS